jgi:hypothetical protein
VVLSSIRSMGKVDCRSVEPHSSIRIPKLRYTYGAKGCYEVGCTKGILCLCLFWTSSTEVLMRTWLCVTFLDGERIVMPERGQGWALTDLVHECTCKDVVISDCVAGCLSVA